MASTSFMKLSLLFQYLRIAETGQLMRQFCWLLIFMVAAWGTAFSIMAFFPCFPVHKYWDLQTRGTCYGFGITYDRTIFVIHTAVNMVFDLVVLAIPIPIYFKRNTPLRAKLGMIALLMLGSMYVYGL